MLLRLKEAARLLNVCEQTARRELKGLSVMVGTRKMYPAEIVRRFVERGSASPRPARERDERAVLG